MATISPVSASVFPNPGNNPKVAGTQSDKNRNAAGPVFLPGTPDGAPPAPALNRLVAIVPGGASTYRDPDHDGPEISVTWIGEDLPEMVTEAARKSESCKQCCSRFWSCLGYVLGCKWARS